MKNLKYCHRLYGRFFRRRDLCEPKNKSRGFTLVEMIVVIAIIAIAAVMVLPFAVSGAGMQIRSAANIIASDLEYAKSMAISRGKIYSVVFDTANESYEIKDYNSTSSSWEVIAHPVKKGFSYVVNFSNDSRLNKVGISSVNFGGTDPDTVEFNYFGSPLNGGVINLLASDGSTVVVNVEPVTGYITISE